MRAGGRLIPLAYGVFGPLGVLTAIFGPALVLFPEYTSAYWAWEIRPAMSAVWVGASYTFGAIAIAVMLRIGRWGGAIVPVAATWVFAVVTLAATLLHQDRFFHGTLNYYIWLAIYLVLPVVLPLIWRPGSRRDPGPQRDDALIPEGIRWAGVVTGCIVGVVSLVMVFSPATAAGFWPWQLTPLMSRVVGAWLLFIATGLLCMLFERRVSAYRPYLLPAAVWFGILFAGSFFHLEEFNFSRAGTWVWFAVAGGAVIAALGVYLYLERISPRTKLLPVA